MLGSIQHGADEQIALEWKECFPEEDGILPAFDALRHDAFPWLLDSALEGGHLGRFSFAGSDPYLVLRISGRMVEEHWRRPVREGSRMGHRVLESDPLPCIRRILPACEGIATDLPVDLPFVGGAVGYLGYEFNRTAKPMSADDSEELTSFADATLLLVDRLFALDHRSGRLFALGLGFGPDPEQARRNASRAVDALIGQLDVPTVSRHTPDPPERFELSERHELLSASPPAGLIAEFDELEYTARVRLIKQQILEGNVYQANLTNRMVVPFSGDSWELYLALRSRSPAPFACFMRVPDGTIVGSSPERFLKVSSGGEVESRPIKGTRPRGTSPNEDAALERALLSSAKDRAENLMIVDLMRNDLGRVCEIGTIRVPELMTI
ncbi:chorismate-binding protein, partial [Myxococcota bacterium]|nr:chorismate-binding protein [Myxococcota bacterium]